MEKTAIDILAELKEELAALQARVDAFEAMLASKKESSDSQDDDAGPSGEQDVVETSAPVSDVETVPEPMAEPSLLDEPPFDPEPVLMATTAAVAEEPIDLDLTDIDSTVDMAAPDADFVNINESEAANVKPAVMDVMAEKCAWKTDMPGTPVKNVLSAISLNDRIHFVKALFADDSALFQQTIMALNSMSSFDEAVHHITSSFPDWKMNSDTVYRFMMAVRRKLK